VRAVRIRFGPEGTPFTLYWDVKDTPASRHWQRMLQAALAREVPLLDRARFHGFPGYRQPAFLISEIHERLRVINAYTGGSIELRSHFDQDYLNALHHHFERFVGAIETPNEFLRQAPDPVREAVRSLNDLIHETEGVLSSGTRRPVLYLEFRDPVRELLSDLEYREFVVQRDFGDVYLHYCMWGKKLLCAWRDDDHHIGDDNIRPLKYVSGEFDVYFGKTDSKDLGDRRYRGFRRWCAERGFDLRDPRLGIGEIIVAKLDRRRGDGWRSREEIVRTLGRLQHVASIDLLDRPAPGPRARLLRGLAHGLSRLRDRANP
jgi:hypothetical protein